MAEALALIRGAAVGGVGAVVVFAAALIAGVARDGSGRVFLAGAVLGGVAGLLEPGSRLSQMVGAILVGVVAIVSGVITGWGMLEYSTLVGSGLAAFWLATGERRLPRLTRWFSWGGAVALLLVVVLLPLILDGGTLGHDESAYALKARAWLEGTPSTGWGFHRGLGMSAYGYAVLALGGSEAGLRMLGLAGVVALAGGAWALGRRMSSPTAGAIASVAVVAAPSMLRRSTEYLSDVPSAALLTFCMVILWRELHDRNLPSYRILWTLPFAWAAFYLRYQSALSLSLMAVTALGLWWPKLRRRPGPVIWLAALGAVGLVPHLIVSTELTGGPFGIMLETGGLVGAYLGEGLGDYISQARFALAGWAGPIGAGLAFGGAAVWRRERPWRTRYLFLLVPAVLQGLILGVVAHGEPRFVFFPITLVVVAGAITAQRLFPAPGRPWARAVALGLVLLVLGSLAQSVAFVRRSVTNRTLGNEAVELAAVEVAREAEGSTCGVMTSFSPQVTYYSGCATVIFRSNLEPGEAVSRLPGEARFLLLVDGGRRQPEGEDRDGLLGITDGPPVIVEGERESAAVYRFAE